MTASEHQAAQSLQEHASTARAETCEPAPTLESAYADGRADEREEAREEARLYRNGNTELLELWMRLLDGDDIFGVQWRVREILEGAGLLQNGTLNWTALEARKPKQQTWEEAVRECITDPAEVERLLAFADEEAESGQQGRVQAAEASGSDKQQTGESA
jgi:hypothetical protein